MSKMNIAIDFDDTITRDMFAFRAIIAAFQNSGHDVYIVTYRSEQGNNSDIKQFCKRLRKGLAGIIYTNLESKEAYMRDLGIEVDIWIDDSPEYILFDLEEAKTVKGHLHNKHPLLDEPKQRAVMKKHQRPSRGRR